MIDRAALAADALTAAVARSGDAVAVWPLPPLEQFPESIRPIAAEYAKLGEEYQATARRRASSNTNG